MTDVVRYKWCSFCRKGGHDDSECWCTRQVGPPPSVAGASIQSMSKLHSSPELLRALGLGCEAGWSALGRRLQEAK